MSWDSKVSSDFQHVWTSHGLTFLYANIKCFWVVGISFGNTLLLSMNFACSSPVETQIHQSYSKLENKYMYSPFLQLKQLNFNPYCFIKLYQFMNDRIKPIHFSIAIGYCISDATLSSLPVIMSIKLLCKQTSKYPLNALFYFPQEQKTGITKLKETWQTLWYIISVVSPQGEQICFTLETMNFNTVLVFLRFLNQSVFRF